MKNYNFWIVGALFLIVALSVFVRLQDYNYPITKGWGKEFVDNNIKQNIANDVMQQFPNLPQNSLVAKVNSEFYNVVKNNKEAYETEIAKASDYFLSQLKSSDGFMYAPDIDTYYWLRQGQNILDNGHVGDKLIDGKSFDTHMNAPFGVETAGSFNPYFGVLLYKVMHFFNDKVTLVFAMMWIPVLIGALAIIPAFFIVRKFSNDIGGLVASVLVAVFPYYIGRSSFGFFDTDVYNVTLPLTILLFFVYLLEAKTGDTKWLWCLFASFSAGLYCFCWAGWWFFFDLLVGVTLLYVLYAAFFRRKTFNFVDCFFKLGLFSVFTAVFVWLFTKSFEQFFGVFTNPLIYLGIKNTLNSNIFPNVFVTVAELSPGSVSLVVNSLLGWIFCCIAFFGIIFLLVSYVIKKNKDTDLWLVFFLLCWFVVGVFMSTKGVRFILLIVGCYVVMLGLLSGKFFTSCIDWFKQIGIGKKLSVAVLLIVFVFLLSTVMIQGINVSKNQMPMMNDVWYDSLTWVKENASEETIIISWWDFGHWFKSVADRGVAFDGASQNSPLAYWVGKMFLTSDENVSYGIARMVACGNDRAFGVVDENFNDTVRSIAILDHIVLLDYEDAMLYLMNNGVINSLDVLDLTHCSDPEFVIVASGDMVGKAAVWSHFGGWNFTRASEYDPVMGDDSWISPWLQYGVNDDLLKDSMFTRMYFGEGAGLERFELVSNLTDFTGSKVMVYKPKGLNSSVTLQ